jgi:hypothetical protein
VPGDPLIGTGDVNRSVLTYQELFSGGASSAPISDSAFALPANAAMPKEVFEGRLDLHLGTSPAHNKVYVDLLSGIFGPSAWQQLPTFSFEFVQNGSYLIPVKQGLVITGDASWNYIIGPGRVWQEKGDAGYTRAAFPFALVERGQNCVHNGEMMFLFSNVKSIRMSNVRYQITQETCTYQKFDLWDQVSATYAPYEIANSGELKSNHATEIRDRIPRKPFAALGSDFPRTNVDLNGFFKTVKFPKDITTYGLYINGTLYVGNCQTRYGEYAFCDEMRLPSYSTAKSAFASMAMMRLGKLYGPSVYGQLVRNFLPEHVIGGDWTNVTFENALSMATGNYVSAAFHADEDSRQEISVLTLESYHDKILTAFGLFPHQADPGTTWVYQSHATFIVTQAMNAFLQKQREKDVDVFNFVRDDVYQPIGISRGGLTTIRTDNSETGRPAGYFGLFFIQDDVAKIGKFLGEQYGAVKGVQVLDPTQLQKALFRNSAALGLVVPYPKDAKFPEQYRYTNAFWGRHISPAEFPQYTCDLWIPYMSGVGGITILVLPNGAVYYVFSDANEFDWLNAVHEINKLKPFCSATR